MDKSGCIAILVFFLIAAGLSILITGGLVAIACWAFNWTFSWKITLGIYAVICLLSMIFGGSKR